MLSRASLWLVLVLAQSPGLPTAPPVAPFELLTVPQRCGATFASRPWQVLSPRALPHLVKHSIHSLSAQLVMTNFMGKLNWAVGYPDIWFNLLGVSVWVFWMT